MWLLSILGSAVMLLSNSCNKENAPDCFQMAGDFATVKRDIDDFESIELRDYITIELYDSSETFVEITAPKNLIPEIETKVENGKLEIENKNTCNFVRSFKKRITVRIYAPNFIDIQNFGTGDIRSINTISSSYFKIENRKAAGEINISLMVDSVSINTHTGVANVTLQGQAQMAGLFNQGLGIIDARNLITSEAYVNNSSINDVYVYSDGYLFGYIQFSGNIYYNGSPDQIDDDIEGSGNIAPIP
ncbi:MAG: head GIN domain-containing protein [Flavobacteriales bacterium]